MSGFISAVMLLLVFAVATASLVVGSLAYNKAYNLSSSGFANHVGSAGAAGPTGGTGTIPSPLVNAKLQQPLTVGGTPTITQTSGTSFLNPVIGVGSNDSSGSIEGELRSPVDISTFLVSFSTAFTQVPSSVTITPANDIVAGQRVYVSSITATQFTFSMSKVDAMTTSPGAIQFYYLVM